MVQLNQNNIDEVNSKMDKRNRVSHTKYEVQEKERREILTSMGDATLLLYQYYLRMAAIPDATMEDSDAARYFDWSIRKVADNRKKLEKNGYFKKKTYKETTGNTRSITYYISKDAVNKTR